MAKKPITSDPKTTKAALANMKAHRDAYPLPKASPKKPVDSQKQKDAQKWMKDYSTSVNSPDQYKKMRKAEREAEAAAAKANKPAASKGQMGRKPTGRGR
jgi:hypothetical protein